MEIRGAGRFRRADTVLAGAIAAGLLAACSGNFPTFDPFGAREHQASACSTTAACSAGQWCDPSTGRCHPLFADGAGCAAGFQCSEGHCVGGVCCNSACTGACRTCDAPGHAGVCTVRGPGAAGEPTCAPFVCDGHSGGCPAACATDRGCVAGDRCVRAECVASKAKGQPCSAPSECASGFCAEGVCCDSACVGACASCDQAGTRGTCTKLAAGSAGSPSCAPFLCDGEAAACPGACADAAACVSGDSCRGGTCTGANGQPCTVGAECASGFCAQGVCCNSACADGCDSCDLPDRPGTCAALAKGSSGSPSCAPFVCDGTSATCPTGCRVDQDCAAGDLCTNGACVARPETIGSSCSANVECASGHCAQGVCCNTACTGPCQACDEPDTPGTCTAIAKRSPGSPSCAPFVCDGSSAACPTACAVGGCVAGDQCSNAQCVAQRVNGDPCSAASECASGHCVEGVCCNSGCAGGCGVCSQAGSVGTCTPVAKGTGSPSCQEWLLCNGTSTSCPSTCELDADCAAGSWCDASSHKCEPKQGDGHTCDADAPDSCTSGHCVDGVCCNTACPGACASCDVSGNAGTCGDASAGSAGSAPCGSFVCNGSSASCPTSCSADGDCISGDYCAGGSCVAKQSNGASCSKADQCTSNNCVDDYCCNTTCGASCDACNVAGSEGTCTPVVKGTLGNPPCRGNYLCNGNLASCPTSCRADSDCVSGYYCDSSTQTCQATQGDGASCSGVDQCTSGYCVNGICCDQPCDGGCGSCDVSGHTGTCTAIGAGHGTLCSPYVCNGRSLSCPKSCSVNGDCIGGDYCSDRSCVPQ